MALMAPVKILVVDDDDSVRSLLRVALPLADPELEVVAEAADGGEAIDIAGRLRPDVIILDHMMPTLTGAAALPDLKRVSPGSDVVFFSAYLDAVGAGEIVREAANTYAAEMVQKGSITELESTVERVASRRRTPPDDAAAA